MMARRKHFRGISKDRVYTVRNAARLVGVTEPTLRKWGKQGLRIISDKRPHLIRGADLIEHVDRKRKANRNDMLAHQMLCMRCQTPRTPKDGTLAYIPYTGATGRLSGLCGTCGAKIGRFCSASEAEELGQTLGNAIKAKTQA